MDTAFAAALVSLLGAIAAGSLNTLAQRALRAFYGSGDDVASEEQTLDSRLAELSRTMSDASQLIALVESEITARQEQVTQLADEVKQQEELAALTKEAKDAVAAVFRSEIVKEGKRAKWQAFWLGFVFFLLGSGVTFLVTYYVHPAWG